MKKTKANISLFELAELTSQKNLIFKALGGVKTNVPTTHNENTGLATSQANQIASVKVSNPLSINSDLIGQKSISHTPPFVLTFEVFNNKLHNCLVDYGASTNVMPYVVCQKLNAQPQKCSTQIVQLDKSTVQVMGELKDVLIRLAFDPSIHQLVDMYVVDIPKSYDMLLKRDLS